MNFHDNTPLETKSEAEEHGGGDVVDIVAKALDALRTDLAGRLDALETKSAGLEKRLSRPAIITAPAEEPMAIERKAFSTYLRKGEKYLSADETKALVASVDAQGGYLAPPEQGAEILKRLVEWSPVRQYARVVTIGAGEIRYPVRATGMSATWVDETEDRPETGSSYSQYPVKVHELGTYVDVSKSLLEDNSYNLDAELGLEFAEAFGKAEAKSFVTGTGAKQPQGLFSADIYGMPVSTGDAKGFKLTNPVDIFLDLFHALPTAHAKNACWLMNRDTMRQIRGWKDNDGRFLLADPVSETAQSTILGRPIVECSDAPNVAAGNMPVIFGDLSGYRIFDRIELQILRDDLTRATKGQVRFHARKRVGAAVTHPDRFVQLKVSA